LSTNILKLGAAALRAVPTPKPGVSAAAYTRALHDWHRSTGLISIYGAAGNLAIIAAELVEAKDDKSKALLAHLERQSVNDKSPSDKMSNGRTREAYNAAQREVMRRRSAAAREAAAAKESAQ
jgi:hypothetical protein